MEEPTEAYFVTKRTKAAEPFCLPTNKGSQQDQEGFIAPVVLNPGKNSI